jgi:hypothetical protein
MKTINDLTEAEAKLLLIKIQRCVQENREMGQSEDIGDQVADELSAVGLEIDVEFDHSDEDDDSDDE